MSGNPALEPPDHLGVPVQGGKVDWPLTQGVGGVRVRPHIHEALRDIRELKARHYTLHLRMMTCVYVHDSLRCICTPGITLVATSAGVAAAGARS